MVVQCVYEVNFILIQQSKHFFGTGCDDFKGNARIFFMKIIKIFFHQPAAKRVRHGNANMTADVLTGIVIFFHITNNLADLMGITKHFFATFSQRDSVINSLEELSV